ncbi:MAG: F0F1 ATP synthase subunit B' [Pseudanabaenaceae cyanobacterium]
MEVPTLTLVAAETATESGGLFNFDATLPIMAFQFLILVAVLSKLFFEPLTGAIDERNAYIREQIAQAKERLNKAQALAKSYEEAIVNARKTAQDTIARAQAEANKIRTQQIAEAMATAQARVAQARAEIEQQKAQAQESLRAEVEILSRDILRKLLGDLAGV